MSALSLNLVHYCTQAMVSQSTQWLFAWIFFLTISKQCLQFTGSLSCSPHSRVCTCSQTSADLIFCFCVLFVFLFDVSLSLLLCSIIDSCFLLVYYNFSPQILQPFLKSFKCNLWLFYLYIYIYTKATLYRFFENVLYAAIFPKALHWPACI